MNGPRQSLLNKRLPSLLSLFCVVIAFVAILWTSTNNVLLGSNAAGGSAPHDVRITNITDTQFTVSYTTDASVLGTISYGQTEKLGTLVMDNRDKPAGNPNPYHVHAITVSSLQPSTTYFFSITSGDSIY